MNDVTIPRIEMLSTGDEVLHGQIIDTNAAWLADYFFQQGVPLSSRETVGDSLSALIAVLIERSQIADILIVNGGLGPTSDDFTAQAAAQACQVELVEHAGWLDRLTAFFAERGRVMTDNNRKQAQLPANAEMLDNPVGTACGFALRLHRCWMFFTPGVPSEFNVMVEQQIMPRLRQQLTLPEPPICLRLTTLGRSESELAHTLSSLSLPAQVSLGFRAATPIIELKLTGPASERPAMEQAWQRVRAVAGENTLYEGVQGLGEILATQLRQQGLSVAVSEQSSAGLLYLQLQAEQVPLSRSELLPDSEEGDLSILMTRAQAIAAKTHSAVVLALGTFSDRQLSIALYTPQGRVGLSFIYPGIGRFSLRQNQQAYVLLAQDLLCRYLQGRAFAAHYALVDMRIEGEVMARLAANLERLS